MTPVQVDDTQRSGLQKGLGQHCAKGPGSAGDKENLP